MTSEREVMEHAAWHETMSLAKEWLNECFNEHPECRWPPSDEDPYLPTRVIEVLGPLQPNVRLIHPGKGRGKWAALSHKWGLQSLTRLERGNINLFSKGIQTSSLPATFRDAIIVARRLGIRYLWIDSLCIVQDSQADWDIEFMKMPEIYQYANVTIAAAATKDSHGGILVERAWKATSKHASCLSYTKDFEGI